ncbi:DinB family protein [Myroides odoratus]|uniref:DinB family protein n=1 Tax=Myroides odoratus TaxID=256 RepID=UPI003342086D
MKNAILEFEHLLEQFSTEVLAIPLEDLQHKLSEEKWSKKEIIGHLIDSATVNYLRFIKAQFQENPQLFYEQVEYCTSANYQDTELNQLLSLWQSLNRQLVFLFHTIHTRNLGHRLCNNQTLAYLIEDYVQHFKHHRAQILA